MIQNLFKHIRPPKEKAEVRTGSPTKIKSDDFEILGDIGKGQFGQVYLVKKLDNGKQYAMKTVDKMSLLDSGRVEQLFSERSVLKRSNHPFIIHLHYTFQSTHRLFFVMDYFPGGDFGHVLETLGRVPEDQARVCAGEVWTALQYLHDNNIIYRDLKPENILIGRDGHLCLTDFGLSKDFELTSSKEGRCDSFVGSPFYIAPEILRHIPYGEAVDWWSFGVLLFRMAAGRVPFKAQAYRQLFSNILNKEPDFKTQPPLSDTIKSLLVSLLQKEESKRINGQGVKDHAFFEGIDWEKLKAKRLPPPVLVKSSPLPMSPTQYSSSPTENIGTAQQKLFEGFTYTGSLGTNKLSASPTSATSAHSEFDSTVSLDDEPTGNSMASSEIMSDLIFSITPSELTPK
eukprot:NODE_3351_length_1367_cov_26.252412_g2916_i0.p1 GENE.NODE_3351_length_1367_cov_26.252412_g2916_i0~~NODE_3351_length_1367_cov_26.252412_g2916_i0.p1  ORF type:complete len:400 (+),score=47.54 NODE_3351_length_1367_cov_26.252412_g2916_i0:51-1250(+)